MNTITADLLPLAVDIDTLNVLENNPRHGDIESVRKSYEQFGQRKPIVARRADRVVIAGNHQLLAARKLGWQDIAVVWVDDDDATAAAFTLADNRTSDLGTYDDALLHALLSQVEAADDAALFASTGFNTFDMAALLENSLNPGAADDGHDDSNEDDEDPAEQIPDRSALLILSDLGWLEPTTETHHGQHWKLGHHDLFVVDLNRDHQVFAPYLKPGKIFAPYPNPHLLGSMSARETPFILVQPRPVLAAHLIDKFIALFGSKNVTEVPA